MRKQDEENPWLELLVSILRYLLVSLFINGIAALLRRIYNWFYRGYSKFYDSVVECKVTDKEFGNVILFFASGNVKTVFPQEVKDDAEYAKEVELFAKSYSTRNIHSVFTNDDKTTTIVYIDGKVVKIRFRQEEGK